MPKSNELSDQDQFGLTLYEVSYRKVVKGTCTFEARDKAEAEDLLSDHLGGNDDQEDELIDYKVIKVKECLD